MTGKLGILAGSGDLPQRLVRVCRDAGRDVFVLAFEGQTEPETTAGVEHAWVHLGSTSATLKILRQAGVTDLVMVGPMTRPNLRDLRLDSLSVKLLAKAGANVLGDDGLLRSIASVFEDEGFQVLGIDDMLGDMLAPAGVYGQHSPDTQAEEDITRGIAVARALGAQDIGQAAVVQQGIILGVEATEGTDRLLERCAELRRNGPGGVLIKVRKPQQDSRVDLPTIGVQTVKQAIAAGLRGIAVQAGGALVVDRPAVVSAADAGGLFVIGVQVGE
ncbi:MAG: LpxI family protein [Alphaproteobacteria bacterium]